MFLQNWVSVKKKKKEKENQFSEENQN